MIHIVRGDPPAALAAIERDELARLREHLELSALASLSPTCPARHAPP